jgi:hypothetical protein
LDRESFDAAPFAFDDVPPPRFDGDFVFMWVSIFDTAVPGLGSFDVRSRRIDPAWR